MKKILCIFLSLILLLSMLGCSDGNIQESSSSSISNEQNPHYRDPNDRSDYEIKIIDGQHYIVFDKEDAYKSYNVQVVGFHMSSLGELKKAVTQRTLTDSQKANIAKSFSKDENGILICDFDNLYVPILPKNMAMKDVLWTGEEISFLCEDNTYDIGGYVTCYASYKRFENYWVKNFANIGSGRVYKSEKTSDRNAIIKYYTTSVGKFKQILYTLVDGLKVIMVSELYTMEIYDSEYNYPLTISDSVPNSVEILGFTEDPNGLDENCFTLYYSAYFGDWTERPSVEWLMEFGLKPYDETVEE